MGKITLFVLIFACIIINQSCYTVSYRGIKKTHNRPLIYFPDNSVINPALEGVWINRQLWMDYGYQYRRLEVYNDGSVIYIPDSERSNSEIFYGNFRTLTDTLIIIFRGSDNTEWMNYELNADTLYIFNIKEKEGTERNLVNDCYNCRRTWLRIQ